MLKTDQMIKHILDLWITYSIISITLLISVALFKIKLYTIDNIAFILVPIIFILIFPVWKFYRTKYVEKNRYILFK